MKIKKYLKIILPVLFVGLLGFLIFQITSKIKHKKEVAENIKTIPNFDFQNVNGGRFTNDNLIKNIPTLFVYFDSECEFCNEEAEMIKQNIDQLSTFQLIFVSIENPDKIKEFAIHHKLINYDKINFLSDTQVSFAPTFDVKSLPCLVLYDKDQHLIEKIKGQINPEVLIEKLTTKN
jgi:peroxiredoxin